MREIEGEMTSNTKDDKPMVELERDGPLIVTGLSGFLNSRGEEIATKKTILLCRCGASKNKPFCSSSHPLFLSSCSWTAPNRASTWSGP